MRIWAAIAMVALGAAAEGLESVPLTSLPPAAKSVGDAGRDLTYTPITPCRLVDTRGFGAPIQGGAFTPNERRTFIPNGACGIPGSGVAVLQITLTTQNLTTNSGGFLSILAPGAPVATSNDIFNIGSQWSATTAKVLTGPAGQFDVYVNTANAHVVVDVAGYFSAPTLASVAFAYTQPTATTISAATTTTIGSPICAAPMNPISGGCKVNDSGVLLIEAFPNQAFGWSCTFRNTTTSIQPVAVWAVCMSLPASVR